MPLFAALRIKNEARWIEAVLRSIQPICDRVFVLDDHSTDSTGAICRGLNATVYDSPFTGLDESRDKDWLLARVMEAVPQEDQHFLNGNPESPYWCLVVDGDEVLMPGDGKYVLEVMRGPVHVRSFRILFLWDAPDRMRVDGVYGRFERPSLFRLMNREFRYQRTPWGNGANFHCSQIPQELLHHARPCAARLLHYGYLDREDRLRKFGWYSQIDPNNEMEGRYLHIVQGDLPEVPADARLKWAGPLSLVSLDSSHAQSCGI